MRRGVHDLKYRGARARSELLADLIVEGLAQRPIAIDLLVPVPLASRRRRQRGFNQSELIARHVGAHLSIPVAPSVLERARETSPQVGRSGADRRENVLGAFRSGSAEPIIGRRIGLVDDVMTTGATLNACAEALKERGASRVYGLVVAHEV